MQGSSGWYYDDLGIQSEWDVDKNGDWHLISQWKQEANGEWTDVTEEYDTIGNMVRPPDITKHTWGKARSPHNLHRCEIGRECLESAL